MYDAIVVGARISGASTAMLLSRAGYKVLLLDRAEVPGGKAAATNLVHPPGVLRLKRWGLLDRLTATGCPPIREYGLRSGPVQLMARLPTVDGVGEAYSRNAAGSTRSCWTRRSRPARNCVPASRSGS
ncbi:FAD-dependent oxidoreductase [Streptomyces sp. M10(2022)]